MVSTQEISHKPEGNYKLLPPDGGWGYVITASVTVMNIVSFIPLTAFGLIYGKFLASVGDETTGTTLTNGIFNTVFSFTGLAASFLLQRYSYRKVGLLGAVLFSLGTFAIIFVTNLTQLIIALGVLQGLGIGLMLPASYSAFNCYFDRRINLMMYIAQALMVSGAIAFPPLTAFLIEYCGFRSTVTMLAVLSLLNFPSMGVLQPVKWHMKKVPMDESSDKETLHKAQTKPLLSKHFNEEHATNKTNSSTHSLFHKKNEHALSRSRFSIISLGDRAASLTVINDLGDDEDDQRLTSSSKLMDLSLLKDLKYLNISTGVSLSYTSDVTFFALIPLILTKAGFDTPEIALLMMVYFGSDLVSRIILAVISAMFHIRNRYVFLAGTLLSAILRTVFVLSDIRIWKMISLAILGFLRCHIQTTLPLVFSEEYNERFPTAFSLYMAVCGVISIIVGFIISVVKSLTQSDEMVVHVLTGAFLICSISWITELFWSKITTRKSPK